MTSSRPAHIELLQLRGELGTERARHLLTRSRVWAMCSAAIVAARNGDPEAFERCVRRLAASGDFANVTEETD